MKREHLLLALIFVPFAVLVFLGFGWLSGSTPASADALDQANPKAPAVASASRPLVPAAPGAPRALPALPQSATRADAIAVAPLAAEALVDAGEVPVPRELAVPLKAIAPQVALCVRDVKSHAEGDVVLRIAFRPTPDGGFDGVSILNSSWQDPYLFACVEDAFDEVRFVPSGAEDFRPAQWSFR